MCVMWFRASDMVKPTFSKCFVVLSVMFGGEFSFCFALGQILCGDKVSSRSLEFGIVSVKAEAVWGKVLCQNQEGFPCEQKERRMQRGCREVHTPLLGTSAVPRALGIKCQALQVSRAVLPGALRGRRAGCAAPSRV